MDKKIKKIILFVGIIFGFFLVAGPALGLEINYPDILGHSLDDTSSLAEFVCYIYGLITSLAFFIAIIIVAFGGVYYLVDYGRGKFTSEAKEWIKAGCLGLLIVVCSSLIAYTINPALTTCTLSFLPGIDINSPNSPTTPPGVPVTTYQEIPIGILTENLLTRTIDCYGFDQNGDPVDGDQITTDDGHKMNGPTYMNHDRADCLTQLVDGAQKKGQIVAMLTAKITNLMNTCSCADTNLNTGAITSKCNPACGPGGCFLPSGQQFGVEEQCTGSCAGPCINGACEQPANPPDCCPDGVKNKIEHGDIELSTALGGGDGSCETEALTYYGLDEFRCPNPRDGEPPCSGIAGFVEEQVLVNKKTITIINQDKWNQLNLIQQLTYFKEEINSFKQKLQGDKNKLSQAKSTLGKCYLAIPYVDLLKTAEGTNRQDRVILAQKPFSDPETKKPIDISKYCQGFNYGNSSCLKKCNDLCPDTSPDAIKAYAACPDCQGPGDQSNCLKTQEECIKKAYDERPCIYSDVNQNFGECITSCQGDCASKCTEKYLPCSDEYNNCVTLCNNNSACVLDNANKCLFGAESFQQCANTNTDQGNIDYCISNAYLCKNGSDEYAGYQSCAKPTNACAVYGYSASSFYDHPECLKCPDPYATSTTGGPSCQQIYPETAKCPTSSTCPGCPCDQIDFQTISFSVPEEAVDGLMMWSSTLPQQVSANQIVGPQCNGYSYNDDPLTFYCENNWWTNPDRDGLSDTPIGTDKVCSKAGEIPVGQAVDNAENWANGLITGANKITQDIQKTISLMKKIGEAKDTSPIQDYCKCGAKLENNEPICKTNCNYAEWIAEIPVYDNEGNYLYSYPQKQCACDFVPCQGNPCEQIVDYLSDLWNSYRKLKLDFIDFYTIMLAEPRSDIMKELAYSRQTTNSCSLTTSAYGSQARLLSCTRVEHEEIAPISNGQTTYKDTTMPGCYGGQGNGHLGKIFNLSDNWFCCQEYTKTPAAANK